MKNKFLIISSVFYMSTGLTDILGTFSEVRNKYKAFFQFIYELIDKTLKTSIFYIDMMMRIQNSS